jgi:hypothetical protein
MNNQELSDQEVLAALQAWKLQQATATEQASPLDTSASATGSRPMGKPSLTEILAQEGLIDPQATTGELDPTILQVILDL